ncbi:hypothetical protein AOQ84DRAFT_14487 [Glonium stellatum]|uniref:Uncharacterized protein n=1 Tax=Glonium stellatum TaxID=574774 RepID=A0A8E2F381_9PEZI|nr:hypothetical protein AOQ84DRAFT_14487 [Glonium stellatum]
MPRGSACPSSYRCTFVTARHATCRCVRCGRVRRWGGVRGEKKGRGEGEGEETRRPLVSMEERREEEAGVWDVGGEEREVQGF